jgi:hypothetical protein
MLQPAFSGPMDNCEKRITSLTQRECLINYIKPEVHLNIIHECISYHKNHTGSPLQGKATLPPRKSPGTHFIGGLVDPRAGLDDMEK